MSDHLGQWRCQYCHFLAKTAFGWKKHLDNFHDGVEIRRVTHVEPTVVCPACENAGKDTLTILPNVTALVEHIEYRHYSLLKAVPLVWDERIAQGFERWLAFHTYLVENRRV